MNLKYDAFMAAMVVVEVNAGNSTVDAAIGIEIGDRDGAIICGALGGAVGAVVTNNDDSHHSSSHGKSHHYN